MKSNGYHFQRIAPKSPEKMTLQFPRLIDTDLVQ
jgi:hypothetical protein